MHVSAGDTAWMLTSTALVRRKPSGFGLASGAVAGLAAIRPDARYVPTWASLVIGGGAGLLFYLAVRLKERLHYHDALDVVGVHMVGGFIGVVLAGGLRLARRERSWRDGRDVAIWKPVVVGHCWSRLPIPDDRDHSVDH